MAAFDPTARFSDRVADYVRYRPDYPPALLAWLQQELGISPGWAVADIGAGTGISSKLFLDAGYRVTAVEPNAAMRAAAIEWLGSNPRFQAIDGRADATDLPDASMDLVIVAQAFHWFDPAGTRREFHRILRAGGLAVIFWNSRKPAGTPFLEGYEALLKRYGIDYAMVAERHASDEAMRAWFGEGLRGEAHFEHHQRLGFDGLLGRLLSSSYTPRADHPNHLPMKHALRELFDSCAVDGAVGLDYDTRVFAGEVH
jgi:SAM-dependent methyltransferase